MSRPAWNQVLRKVVNRVEVGDETLLFVPSVGKPVGWKRQSIARGRATRRVNFAKRELAD